MSYSIFDSGLRTLPVVETKPPEAAHRDSGSRDRYLQLQMSVAQLQKDYAEVHTALVEAAQVHRHLCAPRLVQFGDFDIASETFAVRHVPGDFFTVKDSSRGVILALCDICGKGLGAGMWTTHLVGLVNAHSVMSDEPEEIVKGVNSDLCRLSPAAPMASLFLARLDPISGKFDYCSAGHPPGLLLRAGGDLESLSEGGPLIGVLENASFKKGSVELLEGDVFLACTDGVLESVNQEDSEFGYERLEEQLRVAGGGSAEALLFSVLGAVQDFAATRPLVDDLSIVIVRRRTQTV